MQPLIKIDLEARIDCPNPVIVELGCGRKERPGRITIDKADMRHVNIVADIEDGLGFLPDKSIDEIHCRSVLEHIENFQYLMREIVRVLKDTGTAHIFVPHFSTLITIPTSHTTAFSACILFIISSRAITS